MSGGLQIRAMYKDLVGTQGWTPKRFHDAILQENSMPLEMMRAALSGIKLTPDYKSNWRFDPL